MTEDNKFLKKVLQESVKIAGEEGLTDDAALARVHVIKEDAFLEEPTTDQGKRVRAYALAEESVESPYVKTKYDYDQFRDETVNVALTQALKEIAKYDHLVMLMKETPEYRKDLEKDYNDCSLALFSILNENNVGIGQYKYFFGALAAIMKSLEQFMMEQVNGHKTEIFSRMTGAKNPGTAKYDQFYATYKELTDLLEKSRKDTGNDMADYFGITEEE